VFVIFVAFVIFVPERYYPVISVPARHFPQIAAVA
jgi:hypothetical protein